MVLYLFIFAFYFPCKYLFFLTEENAAELNYSYMKLLMTLTILFSGLL